MCLKASENFVLLLTGLSPFYYKRIFKEAVSEYEEHIVRLLRFGRMATFCCIFFFGDAFQVFIFRKFVVAMSHLETAEVECCRIKF